MSVENSVHSSVDKYPGALSLDTTNTIKSYNLHPPAPTLGITEGVRVFRVKSPPLHEVTAAQRIAALTEVLGKDQNQLGLDIFKIAEAYWRLALNNRVLLEGLIEKLPKSDLHCHLEGILSADDMIDLLVKSTILYWNPVDKEIEVITGQPSSYVKRIPAKELSDARYTNIRDQIRKKLTLDSKPGAIQYDKFFKEVCKIRGDIIENVPLEWILVKIIKNAKKENCIYVELMLELARNEINEPLKELYRQKISQKKTGECYYDAYYNDPIVLNWIQQEVRQSIEKLNVAEKNALDTLNKSEGGVWSKSLTDPESPVCLRYNLEIMRTREDSEFFLKLAAALELAKNDHRIGGITVVGPEKNNLAEARFENQVNIAKFLKGRILNGSEGVNKMTWHIAEHGDTKRGHTDITKLLKAGVADRLGHAVSVKLETIKDISQAGIAVEVCLNSNDLLLGRTGNGHPLDALRLESVPIVVCTDNQGVQKSSVNEEYLNLAMNKGLSFGEFMKLVRNGSRFSFLSKGKGGIFEDTHDKNQYILKACFEGIYNEDFIPNKEACEILQGSEEARLAYRIERAFADFIHKIAIPGYMELKQKFETTQKAGWGIQSSGIHDP